MVSLSVSLVILLAHTQVIFGQDYETHRVPVTQDYTDAFDAAVQEMIVDKSFIDTYANLMYFNVPACTDPVVKYPAKDPFVGRKNLIMCLEIGAVYPFLDVKLLVGNTLVKKINAKYGTNYQAQFKYLNTSKLGFFTTVKNAVDSGECDVITTNVQTLEDRKKQVHFQCHWGTTSQAFLRSELDSSLNLKTLADLNKTNIIVGAYAGTTYEAVVKNNLQAAQYVPFTTADIQYQKVLKKEVHAVIGDAVTFLVWVNANKANCSTCSVNFYGQPYGFSTFTTNNITSLGIPMMSQVSFVGNFIAVVFFLVFMMLIKM
ncbi:hypothetical protein C9374_008190 [Naegleria lovaniensis]|uniref:Solute-binding protein family 3/N-terminal domain-containing protein n=1 Tax=Naegleria lovaniensis TaxID=51637 RepID=A0AA88KHU3_NAELO|nr:uncharacterized protein C9374_008190 [Naegleria lovaniensis]KAG2378551.1 hypothetical protein C9374_008190 [Naegleria lovaniensis]